MKTAPPRVLLKTSTDELFLTSRIVYHMWDEKELVTRLRQLRCMAFDRPRGRWTWNFEHEAKAMGFPAIYESGPAAQQGVMPQDRFNLFHHRVSGESGVSVRAATMPASLDSALTCRAPSNPAPEELD